MPAYQNGHQIPVAQAHGPSYAPVNIQQHTEPVGIPVARPASAAFLQEPARITYPIGQQVPLYAEHVELTNHHREPINDPLPQLPARFAQNPTYRPDIISENPALTGYWVHVPVDDRGPYAVGTRVPARQPINSGVPSYYREANLEFERDHMDGLRPPASGVQRRSHYTPVDHPSNRAGPLERDNSVVRSARTQPKERDKLQYLFDLIRTGLESSGLLRSPDGPSRSYDVREQSHDRTVVARQHRLRASHTRGSKSLVTSKPGHGSVHRPVSDLQREFVDNLGVDRSPSHDIPPFQSYPPLAHPSSAPDHDQYPRRGRSPAPRHSHTYNPSEHSHQHRKVAFGVNTSQNVISPITSVGAVPAPPGDIRHPDVNPSLGTLRGKTRGKRPRSSSSSASSDAEKGKNSRPPLTPGIGQTENHDSGLLVDPWVDGDCHHEFDVEQVAVARGKRTIEYDFPTNWAMQTKGTSTTDKGSIHASSSGDGKVTKRKCLGMFRCPNWNREGKPCRFLERPKTRRDALEAQRHKICPLSSCDKPVLEYVACDVRQEFILYAGGAIFKAFGWHTHPRPSVVKHLTPTERTSLRAVFDVNPTLKPSGLRSGRPDMVGPVKNVRQISSALGNLGRIEYELQTYKKVATKGMSAFEQVLFNFSELHENHPGIIRESSFGPGPTYISIQSDFMRERSVSVEPDYSRPNNGLVTDAAMKFFKNDMLVVIITSKFDIDLRKWIAVNITVSKGQSAEHYGKHFKVLFEGIRERCLELGIEVSDEHLAMVSLLASIRTFNLTHVPGR